MGYESKIYIVEKTRSRYDENSGVWAKVVAMIDMGKVYPLSDQLKKSPKTDCFIYADDGNTLILEDCYGDPLTETSISKAIDMVEKAMKMDGYWRYHILLAALKAAEKYSSPNTVVLHYGH